jgi:hypothetical protein
VKEKPLTWLSVVTITGNHVMSLATSENIPSTQMIGRTPPIHLFLFTVQKTCINLVTKCNKNLVYIYIEHVMLDIKSLKLSVPSLAPYLYREVKVRGREVLKLLYLLGVNNFLSLFLLACTLWCTPV